jgi:hypothetical protein
MTNTEIDNRYWGKLRLIREQATSAARWAGWVNNDIRDLPARPDWQYPTVAEAELAKAEIELEQALLDIRSALTYYKSLPVKSDRELAGAA